MQTQQPFFDADRLAQLQAVGESMTRHETLRTIISAIPQQPQRQDSTVDQLNDLRAVATRLGMYDAADLIRNLIERSGA